MSGLYPNPSGGAGDFRVGDQVRWYVNDREISPYVGVITEICPGINKVWVEFPVGGNQQKDPSELILVSQFVTRSPVSEETGYSSYDKEVSKDDYGTLRDRTVKVAQKLVDSMLSEVSRKDKISKMASDAVRKFATDVVENLAQDIIACCNDNMTDVQAYTKLYPLYANRCSDTFMRESVRRIYKEAAKPGYAGYVPLPEHWMPVPKPAKIPYSELAMHTRKAGAPITAVIMSPTKRYAYVKYGEGRNDYLDGLPSEVMSPEMVDWAEKNAIPDVTGD